MGLNYRYLAIIFLAVFTDLSGATYVFIGHHMFASQKQIIDSLSSSKSLSSYFSINCILHFFSTLSNQIKSGIFIEPTYHPKVSWTALTFRLERESYWFNDRTAMFLALYRSSCIQLQCVDGGAICSRGQEPRMKMIFRRFLQYGL